jgi:hypothetical protein
MLTVNDRLERDAQCDGGKAGCVANLVNPAHQELAALTGHLSAHRGADLLRDPGGVHLDQIGLSGETGNAAAKQRKVPFKLCHTCSIVTFVVGVVGVEFPVAGLVLLGYQPVFLSLEPL